MYLSIDSFLTTIDCVAFDIFDTGCRNINNVQNKYKNGNNSILVYVLGDWQAKTKHIIAVNEYSNTSNISMVINLVFRHIFHA